MTEVTVEIDIDEAVDTALDNIDMSHYIDHDDILSDVHNYIDNDAIRYAIEDDILNQVNDYIDEDDIRWKMEDHFVDNDVFHALTTKVQELQALMAKLLEVINLPEEPPSHIETMQQAPLEDVRDIYMARRDERYQTIRYMSKPELVAWCEEQNYYVDGMTVKEIHEMIL
jgi:hypothetical protein